MKKRMSSVLAFFLTWTTYGTWLPGDSRGWVDRHRTHGEVVEPPQTALEDHARGLLKETPVELNASMRAAVDAAMRRICDELGWCVHALEVLSNHVHVVVTVQDATPGKAMGILKVHGTRALNTLDGSGGRDRWWTKDGSKRIMNSQESLNAAIRYVTNQEKPPASRGDMMTLKRRM